MNYKEFNVKEFKIGQKVIRPAVDGLIFSVVEFIPTVDLFITKISPSDLRCPDNNIHAYDFNGDLVWTISQPILLPPGKEAPFRYSEKRRLPGEAPEDIYFHYSGNDVILDLRNGKTRFQNPQEALYFFSKNYILPCGAHPEKQIRLIDKFIVMTGDRGPCEVGPNNIFAFKDDGTLLWQIKWPKEVPLDENGGYTSVYLHYGKLSGYLIAGYSVDIDPETGETSNPVFVR